MTKCMCTSEMVCTDQMYRQTRINPKNQKSIWVGLRRLARTIGDYTVEVYRYSNDMAPIFSNGGTRVLIRPDRIDLI